MKIKKLVCMTLACSMIFSMSAFAEEKDEVVSIVNEDADRILFEELSAQNSIASNADFVPLDQLSVRFDMESLSDLSDVVTYATTGDQYEPNNTPATATTGLAGKKVKATIHDESDWDWYKIDILDISQPYSFVLMDIPAGCDYDLYLVTSDLQLAYAYIQEGNTTEEFYLNFTAPGTYYVSVQSYSGYSTSPYTLYFGPAYKVGNTNWIGPIGEFSFGYVPRGSYDTYVGSLTFDLTNDTTIPAGAVLTDLMITADGNNTDWAGFYKYIAPVGGATMKQIGNLPTFDVPDMVYLVKQKWSVWGSVQYSNYFIWSPRIYMGYKFVVAPGTMNFVS